MKRVSRRVFAPIVVFTVSIGLLVGGCGGAGQINVIPLNFRKLDDSDWLIHEIEADRGYYWQDQSQLYVALTADRSSILGEYGKQTMVMSLVVNGLPAGVSRIYRVNNQTFRMVSRRGVDHRRWASLAGIVVIQREPNGRLSGRFRISVKGQKFHIATGWAGNSRALLVGSFVAVPDQDLGRSILERSEADGMNRKRSP